MPPHHHRPPFLIEQGTRTIHYTNGGDATELVHPLLWQGSYLPPSLLHQYDFASTVYCAQELIPDKGELPRDITTIISPMRDEFDMANAKRYWRLAVSTARATAQEVLAGHRTLVQCHLGLNRSGLVSALTLHMLFGWSGAQCVGFIQRKRENALSNPAFVRMIEKVPASKGTK